MTFKNFGLYREANEDERRKIKLKMEKWIVKNRMRKINYNLLTGDLTV